MIHVSFSFASWWLPTIVTFACAAFFFLTVHKAIGRRSADRYGLYPVLVTAVSAPALAVVAISWALYALFK